jgi:hypothetical protein
MGWLVETRLFEAGWIDTRYAVSWDLRQFSIKTEILLLYDLPSRKIRTFLDSLPNLLWNNLPWDDRMEASKAQRLGLRVDVFEFFKMWLSQLLACVAMSWGWGGGGGSGSWGLTLPELSERFVSTYTVYVIVKHEMSPVVQ